MPPLRFAFEKPEETMPVKPTANEEEYFARQEAERRRKIAEQRQIQGKLKSESVTEFFTS
jgi:hypothetical protein